MGSKTRISEKKRKHTQVEQSEATKPAETTVEPSRSIERQDDMREDKKRNLEALFKHPISSNNGIDDVDSGNTSKDLAGDTPQFSFFGAQSEDSEDEGGNKDEDHSSESSDPDSSEDENDGQGVNSTANSDGTKRKAAVTPTVTNESDFANWFWENRGENNRAWKRRRREAAKEKRQRENRQRGLKGR